MIRIVVADDHTIFRQGLLGLLSSEKDIVIAGEAGNGRDALALIVETEPDVAILDVSMPEPGGIEIAREIQRRGLDTRVVILTMHKETLTSDRALRSGANGYILKDNAFDELLYAIRAVVAGGTFISPLISGKILEDLAKRTNEQSTITKRELEVLRLIAEGLTNRHIAETLFISIKTVETHRSRVMRKLDLHNTADIVKYAINAGLLE